MPWLLYPLDKTGVRGAPELVWRFWRRQKSLTHTRIWMPDHPARSLTSILCMISIKMLHTSNYTVHLCAWKETALCYASFFHYAVACHKNSHTLTSIHFSVQKYICYPLFLKPIMLQHISCKPTVSMCTSCYNYFPKHTWIIALYKIYAKLDNRKGLLLHAMQN